MPSYFDSSRVQFPNNAGVLLAARARSSLFGNGETHRTAFSFAALAGAALLEAVLLIAEWIRGLGRNRARSTSTACRGSAAAIRLLHRVSWTADWRTTGQGGGAGSRWARRARVIGASLCASLGPCASPTRSESLGQRQCYARQGPLCPTLPDPARDCPRLPAAARAFARRSGRPGWPATGGRVEGGYGAVGAVA